MKQLMEEKNKEISDKIRYHAEFIKNELNEIDKEMYMIVANVKFNESRVF